MTPAWIALVVGLAAGFLIGYARGVAACMPRRRKSRAAKFSNVYELGKERPVGKVKS